MSYLTYGTAAVITGIPGQPIQWPALRPIKLSVEMAEGSSPLPPR